MHGDDYTAERAIAQVEVCGFNAAILVPPDVWFTGAAVSSLLYGTSTAGTP